MTKKKKEVLTTKVNTKVLMTDNFFFKYKSTCGEGT